MKKLSREQMKKITGGVAPKTSCSCTCTHGSTGAWTYDNNAQPSEGYLMNDIDRYCASGGGYCEGCTNW